MHAVTKMAKIRQNRQILQADFASTNLTKNLPKSMNIHTVCRNFVKLSISVTKCTLDTSRVLMGLTFNRETSKNLAIKRTN